MGILNAFNRIGRPGSYSDDTSEHIRSSLDNFRRRHKTDRISAGREGLSLRARWRNFSQRGYSRSYNVERNVDMPYWARQISDISVDRPDFEMSGGLGTDRRSPDRRDTRYKVYQYRSDSRRHEADKSPRADWFVYDRQHKAPREARYREYRPSEGRRDDARDRKNGRSKDRARTAYCSDDLPPQIHRDTSRTADRHRSTFKNRHTYSRHGPHATLRSKPANDGRYRTVHRKDPWPARREHDHRRRRAPQYGYDIHFRGVVEIWPWNERTSREDDDPPSPHHRHNFRPSGGLSGPDRDRYKQARKHRSPWRDERDERSLDSRRQDPRHTSQDIEPDYRWPGRGRTIKRDGRRETVFRDDSSEEADYRWHGRGWPSKRDERRERASTGNILPNESDMPRRPVPGGVSHPRRSDSAGKPQSAQSAKSVSAYSTHSSQSSPMSEVLPLRPHAGKQAMPRTDGGATLRDGATPAAVPLASKQALFGTVRPHNSIAPTAVSHTTNQAQRTSDSIAPRTSSSAPTPPAHYPMNVPYHIDRGDGGIIVVEDGASTRSTHSGSEDKYSRVTRHSQRSVSVTEAPTAGVDNGRGATHSNRSPGSAAPAATNFLPGNPNPAKGPPLRPPPEPLMSRHPLRSTESYNGVQTSTRPIYPAQSQDPPYTRILKPVSPPGPKTLPRGVAHCPPEQVQYARYDRVSVTRHQPLQQYSRTAGTREPAPKHNPSASKQGGALPQHFPGQNVPQNLPRPPLQGASRPSYHQHADAREPPYNLGQPSREQATADLGQPAGWGPRSPDGGTARHPQNRPLPPLPQQSIRQPTNASGPIPSERPSRSEERRAERCDLSTDSRQNPRDDRNRSRSYDSYVSENSGRTQESGQ